MPSFFSPSWYLVSDLIITVRPDVQVVRHNYRGRTWYVMYDPLTGQSHRLSKEAYDVIGLCDGSCDVNTAWENACEKLDEDMPSQDDVISLLSRLFRHNVLVANRQPDFIALYKRQKENKRRKLIQKLKSPMGIKIPMIDPNDFLDRTIHWVRPLISVWGALIWLIVVILGVVLASLHWPSLSSNVSDRVLSMSNLFLLALIYPVVKTVHELGHAYVVKHWGGEVHEIGVMLLVFFPVPYVDASSASVFTSKYQRMLVGAAGILVELFIAGIAMIVWTLVEPGIIRSLAFNTMMITGVSTLFFNGNPLLRFDAYYVLADFLEIPNLASRSNQQVGYMIKTRLLDIKNQQSKAYSTRENIYLLTYSVAAFIYRLFIMAVIAIFVASQYFIIGILLALWSFYAGLFAPVLKVVSHCMNDFHLQRKRTRVIVFTASGSALLSALLFLTPVPYSTYAEGVILAEENSHVRAETSGFVKSILTPSGETIEKGHELVVLEAPSLEYELQEREAALRVAKVQYQASAKDKSALAIRREVLDYAEKELQRSRERYEGLIIKSPSSGVFLVADAQNMPGRYIVRGEPLGYVVDYDRIPVTLMLSEDHVNRVVNKTDLIEISLASMPDKIYHGQIQRFYPSSTKEVPSDILTVDGGGNIVPDPSEHRQLMSVTPLFKLLVDADDLPVTRINERVHVLFRHPAEPVGWRLLRGIRRVFLRQLNV